MKPDLMEDDFGVPSIIIRRLPLRGGEGIMVGKKSYDKQAAEFYDYCSSIVIGTASDFPRWESLEIIHDGRKIAERNYDELIQLAYDHLNEKIEGRFRYKTGAMIEIARGTNVVYTVELLNDNGEVSGCLLATIPPDKDRIIIFIQVDEILFDNPEN